MDVNQTRFHLVYGKAEWYSQAAVASPPSSPPQEPSLDWNDGDATLSLHQELFIFSQTCGTKSAALRRSAAAQGATGTETGIGLGMKAKTSGSLELPKKVPRFSGLLPI